MLSANELKKNTKKLLKNKNKDSNHEVEEFLSLLVQYPKPLESPKKSQ